MAFPKIPYELSRIAAKFMVGSLLAPFVLTVLESVLNVFGLGLFLFPGASASEWGDLFMLGRVYAAMISPVFVAFAYALLGWIIAMPGVFVATRGPMLATLIFGFAAVVTVSGLRNGYWYITLVSNAVLVWLAIASWKPRNYVHQPPVATGLHEMTAYQRSRSDMQT